MPSLTDAFVQRVIRFEGSTRPVGLLRIALGCIAWAEYANILAPHRLGSFDGLSLSGVYFASSTMTVVGYAARPAAIVLGALQMAMVLFGPPEPWGHHHCWLLGIATLLVGLTPCDRSFSVDRWLDIQHCERKGRPIPEERGPLWATRLIALQLCMLYVFAVADKLTPGFLSGQRLEMIFAEKITGSVPVALPGWPLLLLAASWGTVAIEAFLAVGMWVPRIRPRALVLAMLVHAAFYLLIPVATFSVTTLALWIVLFDPDAIHRGIDRLQARPIPA
jgi:hypothetical protein